MKMRSTQLSWIRIAVTTAAATVGLSAAQSAYGALVIKSGDTIDGWKVTFPAGVSLTAGADATLELHKSAAFDSTEGLDITFTQISASASPTISVLDETVANDTASGFGQFQFLLLNTLPGDAKAAAFDSAGDTFSAIAPFTSSAFSADTITLSGGVINPGATADFGGNPLVIDANPAATGIKKVFDFKEIPTAAPASVPLPAAVWSGSALLGLLGVIAGAKNVRRLLA